MPGWNFKNGKLEKCQISEDEYWSLFNFIFSNACIKRNTYKFGLIKSIIDNLFNYTQDDCGSYRLSYSISVLLKSINQASIHFNSQNRHPVCGESHCIEGVW